MLAFFSLVGLLLGAPGIYGVVSFLVSQRTKEIGVRIAIGATAQQVRLLVLRNAILWTAAGCTAAVAILAVALPYVKNLLYERPPVRPWSMAGVLAAMALVSILAALVPAMRASRLDPMKTLRQD